ncbi:hypothetical protein HK103_004420 [Boothiomyces macroporosus]|uniref:ABC transporter domain-containing protein n=1 Tax=Boothiomyces macroporosus TaxID=261099 RepID=A0AAD5UH85_9FUNG|nr:hypothetical protein HK103_004404 [Boothiomyces macroporosus]KAJ3257648.1 hypothetical protein HK103_004420 [Boothiomyces macroporosus]
MENIDINGSLVSEMQTEVVSDTLESIENNNLEVKLNIGEEQEGGIVKEEMETVVGSAIQDVKGKHEVEQQEKLRKSRQSMAVVGRAIQYQKRQWFTNICCISLCPLLMAALASILGNFILNALTSTIPIEEYLYCSNVAAMDSMNIPIWNLENPNLPKNSSDGIKGAKLPIYTNVNFRFFGGRPQPCVLWYGEDYPKSSVYERPTTASGNKIRDTTLMAQPINGWFKALESGQIDQFTIFTFIRKQLYPWTFVSADPSVDFSLLGTKTKLDAIDMNNFLNGSGPAFVPASPNSGLLNTLPTKYYLDVSFNSSLSYKFNGFLPSPYYNVTSKTIPELDDLLAEYILNTTTQIVNLPKSGFSNANTDMASDIDIFLEINEILKNLPHGALYFDKIDHKKLRYSWTYLFGGGDVIESTDFAGPVARMMYQQTQLDNAILRNSNVTAFSNASITQGLRTFPTYESTKLDFPIGGLLGSTLYPFGISFLLPIFVITLVSEKESRILLMMRMNGMKSWYYYATHYITMLILYCASAAIFYCTGLYFKLTLFTLTDTSLLLFALFVWGNCQIALAFLFSAIFKKSRDALVYVFLIVLCSVVIALFLDNIYFGEPYPSVMFVWPPFAFYHSLSLMNFASFLKREIPFKFADLFGQNEVALALKFLVVEVFVYFGIAMYIESILPTEYGIRKPWYFPVEFLWKNVRHGTMEQPSIAPVQSYENHLEDLDVKAERDRVLNDRYDESENLLVVKNMRKVYKDRGDGEKIAVDSVTFAVEKGIVFGLLGPNGAGKTTLINILTGLYESTHGAARIAGFDIHTENQSVYQNIGICPQFDILWDDLTPLDHLYFYARLKGVERSQENTAVNGIIQQLKMGEYKNRLSKHLSGGEKRRLSIAISLIGFPTVVFLDEPTTGLDPEVRRSIWNTINEAREGKTIVLTTHSMEEAEALCQKIAIMAKGSLRCISNQTRLKELYGSGYKLYTNSNPQDTEKVASFIESILPEGWTKVDSFSTNLSYEFPAQKGFISKIFHEIEAKKADVGILDYGIGQTTLEEVFIKLVDEDLL